ncbi:MAG: glycosyltransferase family 2 protein [Anaerolineales bacterium]|nr:glycosyltransferase family 2 protein [Anaerolineales bacterium]
MIIPCYNEQETIASLLWAIYRQTYPIEQIEVIIADGMSTDHTRQVVEAFVAEHPGLAVQLIENPERVIPKALNRAIDHARGEIILRLDAHSMPNEDYIQRCVAALEKKLGENVGGMWEIEAGENTWIARSIAIAAAHPFGVGDARYRVGGKAQYVDTVPFGAFWKSLFERIGKFNESLLTNEDYEFNTRIRLNGGKIWFDPAIRTKYFARKTLAELTKQYWRYGYWKAKMVRLYPKTLRWRQLLPPLFVFSLLILLLLAPFFPLVRFGLVFEIGFYFLILFVVGAKEALARKALYLMFGLPMSMATMHLAWGAGFLWSMVTANGK